MSGLLSPDTGYFRLFSLFSFWRASARLRLKKKKFLENFSVSGACSFHGADFCHNDKEAAVNTRRIYKAFAKVRAKIRPSKPMRVRISSAMDSIHPFWTFFPIPKGAVKKTCVFFTAPLVLSSFGRQTDLLFCEKPVFTALSELCNHSHSLPKTVT